MLYDESHNGISNPTEIISSPKNMNVYYVVISALTLKLFHNFKTSYVIQY